MSASIVSSKKQPRSLLVTAVGIALASASHISVAQENTAAVELDSQTVVGETPAYRTTHSVSVKNTAPLFDTPQTIQVIPAEVIKEQQALSLRQVLSNVSGITFNAGEGVVVQVTASIFVALAPMPICKLMAYATARKLTVLTPLILKPLK